MRDVGGLARVLAGLNPDTATCDADLLAAAIVFARCTGADARMKAKWVRYAFRASRQLWGDAHPTTLRISRGYQRLMIELGHLLAAVHAADHRLRVYRRTGCVEQELSTGLELAALLSAARLCESALEQIAAAWTTWQAGRGDPDTGRRILFDHAVLLAGCAQSADAITLLSNHYGLLRGADAVLIDLTAHRLSTAEICHPPTCRHPARANSVDMGGDRLSFWTGLLENAAPGEFAITPGPWLVGYTGAAPTSEVASSDGATA